MKDKNREFIQRLEIVLEELGWSKKKLAQESGLSSTSISRWKNPNSQPPSKASISLISKATGFTEEWLETGEGMKRETDVFDLVSLDPYTTNEDEVRQVRMYRKLAHMDADTLGEIQTWLNDMERLRPGFTGWFRLEFQNRFPEFDEWKEKITKNRKNGTDN